MAHLILQHSRVETISAPGGDVILKLVTNVANMSPLFPDSSSQVFFSCAGLGRATSAGHH